MLMGVKKLCKRPIYSIIKIQSKEAATRVAFLLEGFPPEILCLMCDDVIVFMLLTWFII